MELTTGTLLGGKVAYRQPVGHYRTGIEPVLLAAWVRARGGDRVMEAGSGAGAGLLCLWQRVPEVDGVGVEIDADLARLAQSNAELNGAALQFRCCDILAAPPSPAFDHVFSNPPWHRAAATPSPDPMKRRAKQAAPGMLTAWVGALARCLRHRGTLTLALPAASVAEAASALISAKLGSVTLLPLWPRVGAPAKLMLVRAVLGGKGDGTILPGLVLHQADGTYTPDARCILHDGKAIPD